MDNNNYSLEDVDTKQEFYSSDVIEQPIVEDQPTPDLNNYEVQDNTNNNKAKKKSSILIIACIGIFLISLFGVITAFVLSENGSFSSFISTPFKAITSESKKDKEEFEKEETEEVEEENPEIIEEQLEETPTQEESKPEQPSTPATTPEQPSASNPEPRIPSEPQLSREEQIRNNPDYIYYGYLDLPNNSNFNPNGTITRAEFAKWIALALNLDTNKVVKNPFPDLAGYEEYKDYILAVYNEGYMKGTDGKFDPGLNITRLQALLVTIRILEKNNLYPDNYCEEIDFTDVKGNRIQITKKGSKYCITKGITATTFGPDQDITRKAVVTFLYRAMKRDHPNMECVEDQTITFADVSPSSSLYNRISEAAVNHYCVYK